MNQCSMNICKYKYDCMIVCKVKYTEEKLNKNCKVFDIFAKKSLKYSFSSSPNYFETFSRLCRVVCLMSHA